MAGATAVIIDLEALRSRALEVRDGYLEECLAAGTLTDAGLRISVDAYAGIKSKYSGGLGDVVAAVAKPTAALIDGLLGTALVKCGRCKKRRKWLNSIGI